MLKYQTLLLLWTTLAPLCFGNYYRLVFEGIVAADTYNDTPFNLYDEFRAELILDSSFPGTALFDETSVAYSDNVLMIKFKIGDYLFYTHEGTIQPYNDFPIGWGDLNDGAYVSSGYMTNSQYPEIKNVLFDFHFSAESDLLDDLSFENTIGIFEYYDLYRLGESFDFTYNNKNHYSSLEIEDYYSELIDPPPLINVIHGSFQLEYSELESENIHADLSFIYDPERQKGSIYGLFGIFYDNLIEFEVFQSGNQINPETFSALTDFQTVTWQISSKDASTGNLSLSGFSALTQSNKEYTGSTSNWQQRTPYHELEINCRPSIDQEKDGSIRLTIIIKNMRIGARYSLLWAENLSDTWTEIDELVGTSYSQMWSSLPYSQLKENELTDIFNTTTHSSGFFKLEEK